MERRSLVIKSMNEGGSGGVVCNSGEAGYRGRDSKSVRIFAFRGKEKRGLKAAA